MPHQRTRQRRTRPLLCFTRVILSGYVRVGPAMTVKSVWANWVICSWWNEGYGGFETAGFPIAMIEGPVMLSPDDASPQTDGQVVAPKARFEFARQALTSAN